MTGRRWLLIFFFIFGIVFLGWLIIRRDQGPATASVLVEHGESGRPLVGIPVEAGGFAAETDDNGRAFFDNLSPGSTTFKVSFVDFRDFFQTATLEQGENEEILFSLELATAQVRGKVLDSRSGKPIVGAVVTGGGVVGETDADGRFVLDEAVIGTPTLVVVKDGYEEFSLEVPLVRGVIKDLGNLSLENLADSQ